MKPVLIAVISLIIIATSLPLLLTVMPWESAMRIVGLTLTTGGVVFSFAFLN